MKYDVLNDGEGTLVGLCKSVLVKKSKFAPDPQKPKRSVLRVLFLSLGWFVVSSFVPYSNRCMQVPSILN